jgi:hypothetical protein
LAGDGDLTRAGITTVNVSKAEFVSLDAGSGANDIDVTTGTAVEFFIDGNDPPVGTPGDALTVHLAGATGMVFTPGGPGAGVYSFANRQDISFVEIETHGTLLTGTVAGTTHGAAGPGLSPASLAAVADAAASLWESLRTGTTLPEVAVSVADLPGTTLAKAVGHSIIVDSHAAGIGWFVDDTPWDAAEFAAVPGRRSLTAEAGSAAEGKYDLLTAIAHEYGHLLGYDHAQDGQSLMSERLSPGERRLPDANAADVPLLDAIAADVFPFWKGS